VQPLAQQQQKAWVLREQLWELGKESEPSSGKPQSVVELASQFVVEPAESLPQLSAPVEWWV